MTQTTIATGLQTKALTVNLEINQWSARKHDKKITKEVEDTHNATDAGRYNKLLIAKEAIQKIQKAANAARLFHYENTLPWANNGDRLLPAANYFTYVTEMNRLKSEFEKEVTDFLANYSTVVDDAKIRLNGMFNSADYPSESEIKSRFGFKTEFMPLPDNDFRLNLSQTEINNLTLAVENSMKDRINNAVKNTWERIKEQLLHMKDRLSQPDAKFHDSLFNNLRDIIELLPKLNVTNDAAISDICNEMQTLLVNPDAVRANSNLRADKANEVERLLNKFDSFFS
jgi:membrane-bound lytic murein transglycosylase